MLSQKNDVKKRLLAYPVQAFTKFRVENTHKSMDACNYARKQRRSIKTTWAKTSIFNYDL